MCEAVCDGVRDRVEGQMGTRRSEYDLCTHTQLEWGWGGGTLLQSFYNACDIYEKPN